MMPENNLSWYKGDYGYYGNNEKFDSPRSVREPYNSLSHYKKDHIKRFDELNNGLADSYSLTKGGALLSIRNQQDNGSINYDINNQNDSKFHIRPHDLRSVWIPKKFEGRNMYLTIYNYRLFFRRLKNKVLFLQVCFPYRFYNFS